MFDLNPFSGQLEDKGKSTATLDARYLRISQNLSDLNNASTARSNLGLGSIATQNANNVSITGGSVTGITLSGSLSGTLSGGNQDIGTLSSTVKKLALTGSQSLDIYIPVATGNADSGYLRFIGGNANGDVLNANAATIDLYGAGNVGAGAMAFYTPRADGAAIIKRLDLSGNAATATATWSSTNHDFGSGTATFGGTVTHQGDTTLSSATATIYANNAAGFLAIVSQRTAANAGIGYYLQSNNASNVTTTRFSLTSGVNTAVAAWSDVTHTGFVASGDMYLRNNINLYFRDSTNSSVTALIVADGSNVFTLTAANTLLTQSQGSTILKTYNNASAYTTRLTITGGSATADATWSAVNHNFGTGTALFGGALTMANNTYIQGKDTGGTARGLLTIDNTDLIILNPGATNPLLISATLTKVAGAFYVPRQDGASQTTVGFLADNGVPSNTYGNDGDYYFRGNGTSGSCIYHKESGSWVAIA